MKSIQDLIPVFESLAPLGYAEDFDNVGLLVGNVQQQVTGILVCHDAIESVIDEAIEQKCNLVVCFHPIWFSGLKRLNGNTYVERAIMKAIQHQIAIYAIHTAFDNHPLGVNHIACQALGLEDLHILLPKKQFLKKLITYAPLAQAEQIREALLNAGAGQIGNYDRCSFRTEGVGSFRGKPGSNPVIGEAEQYTEVAEQKIEVIVEKHLASTVLKALHQAHPYEEVAYELTPIENDLQTVGLGMLGTLPQPLSEKAFLQQVKEVFVCGGIRHSLFTGKTIQKVAFLGGSGGFAIQAAQKAGADAFITADLKYHQFYEAENNLLLADIGHFESERYTKIYIAEFLKEKITNFAIVLSNVDSNPINYF
ncbi:MAG: Nif3-like dinuclear metal center hexameric protein [Flavobacterium sp. BFFFF2]|nr:MAG: Nif3-like dinuclear metal center hexameric protein [Flavobacterium sp. BFFFF2]